MPPKTRALRAILDSQRFVRAFRAILDSKKSWALRTILTNVNKGFVHVVLQRRRRGEVRQRVYTGNEL